MYSSVSMLLVGDNSVVNDLRLMTSVELYLHADYYCKHPCFCSVFEKYKDRPFKSLSGMVAMSVSFGAVDTNLSLDELVRAEAVLNCSDKQWCGFLCLLALSTVTSRNISSYYPDCDSDVIRWSLLFNQQIQPRPPMKPAPGTEDLNILFCLEGLLPSSVTFKHNHYVPLIPACASALANKRKLISSLPKSKKRCTVQSKLTFLPSDSNKVKEINKTSSGTEPPLSGIVLESVPPILSNDVPCSSASLVSPESVSSLSDTVVSTAQHNDTTRSASPANGECSNNFDVAFYREKVKGMTNAEIDNLLKNVFVPETSFKFPKTNGRSFRLDWIKSHPWLCYSPSLDGGFCLSCVLFGDRFHSKLGKIRKLFSEPITHWPDAKAALLRHENASSGLHRETTTIVTALLDNLSGKTLPIDVVIDTNLRKKIAENREKTCSYCRHCHSLWSSTATSERS